MKYIIIALTLLALLLIVFGFSIALDISQKLIGSGVALLFLIVFPLFSYYRWKGKDIKDYMLTKENLDKMRQNQKNNRH